MENVTIHTASFTADQKLIDFINNKMEKLNQYFHKIISADVFLKLDSKGNTVNDKTVEVKLMVPGSKLFASTSDKVFESAANESIDNVRRQLVRYKEKMRNR